MPQAPNPANEAERIAALHALDLLDTPAEPEFDRITQLLARTLQVPIALVSLVDTHRQWFKSRLGLEAAETPRSAAFCAHAILDDAPLVVSDTTKDQRFIDNPLVNQHPKIRFYAGVPIRSPNGYALGTLCAIDTTPRDLKADELATLTDLAALVSKEIQAREAAQLSRQHISHAKDRFADSEERFRAVFDIAAVGIALVATDGSWMRVNDALCRIVGYTQEELSHLTFQDITHPDDLEKDLSLLGQLVAGEIAQYELEKRYRRKDGELVWIHLSVTKKLGPNGELEHFVSIIQDIHARKTAEAALEALTHSLEARVAERTLELSESNELLSFSMTQQAHFEQALLKREAELSAVIENANDAYVCMDDAGRVTAWNRQAVETFGWSAAEAIGHELGELIIPLHLRAAHRTGMQRYLASGVGHVLDQRLELTAMRKDASSLPVEIRIRALEIGGQKLFSAFLHDITERKRAEEAQEYEARHDLLTGLPNRRAFFERLPQAIARANRGKKPMALLFIDLDGFKAVNDQHGHDTGDALLQEIANRIATTVRQTDSAARLAGDEFTVMLEGLVHGESDAMAISNKILKQINAAVTIGTISVQVSASIGITVHQPGTEISPEALLKIADTAMYEAKNKGKAHIRVL